MHNEREDFTRAGVAHTLSSSYEGDAAKWLFWIHFDAWPAQHQRGDMGACCMARKGYINSSRTNGGQRRVRLKRHRLIHSPTQAGDADRATWFWLAAYSPNAAANAERIGHTFAVRDIDRWLAGTERDLPWRLLLADASWCCFSSGFMGVFHALTDESDI